VENGVCGNVLTTLKIRIQRYYFTENFSAHVASYWELQVMSLNKMYGVKIFRKFQGSELSTSMVKFICTTLDALQSLKFQHIVWDVFLTDVGLEMRDLTGSEIVLCRSIKIH
jgi:uncharacterized membrane protein YwzB